MEGNKGSSIEQGHRLYEERDPWHRELPITGARSYHRLGRGRDKDAEGGYFTW